MTDNLAMSDNGTKGLVLDYGGVLTTPIGPSFRAFEQAHGIEHGLVFRLLIEASKDETGGVIGAIDNSRKAVYGYDQRAEVFGSAGSIATTNCYPNQAILCTAESVHRDLPLNFFMDRYTESFVNELRAFVHAVLEDLTPPVTGIDGRIPVVMGMDARKF